MELLWKLFRYLLGINNKEKLSFFNAIYFLNEKRKGEFHAPIFKEKKFFSILFLKNFFFHEFIFFPSPSFSLSLSRSLLFQCSIFLQRKSVIILYTLQRQMFEKIP